MSDTPLFTTTPIYYSSNNFQFQSCPYTATPTPSSNYMSSSSSSCYPSSCYPSSCYPSSYYSNSKQKQQNIFFDINNGFPIIAAIDISENSESKQTESETHIISTPPATPNSIVISSYDDNITSNIESIRISPQNLKIKIPKTVNNMKSKTLIPAKIKRDGIKKEDLTLSLHGYHKQKCVGNTLQGQVISAIYKNKGNFKFIIKISNKRQYFEKITYYKGKRYITKEDILKEAQIMKGFMSNTLIPPSLIRYYDFFEDKQNFYLVMEHGGMDLFDFIVKCHDLIRSNKLSLREWRRHCKFMFAQMILCVNWLHTIQCCCHLDISLENMVVSEGVRITENEQEFRNNKCYIKLIDFGVAEYFDPDSNPYFLCNKFVGKQYYKAPKVYQQRGPFRANKADIWSLGVVLFMITTGSPPYSEPIDSDVAFKYIKNNQLFHLLQRWNKTKYVTHNLFDLLTKMLCCDELKRIEMNDIMQHPWIKIYFPDQNKTNNY